MAITQFMINKRKKLPLSIVILAKNEAENLRHLLPTLGFVKELLVIDDQSSDETAQVAKAFGAKVHNYPVGQDFAAARNWALTVASSSWVLFLDADERLNKPAVEHIKKICEKRSKTQGYSFKREDYLWDKKVDFGEVGCTTLVRLGPRSSQTWSGAVHEVWNIEHIEQARGKINHYSHKSFLTSIKKINTYAAKAASSKSKQGISWTWTEIILYPLAKFFQNYIVRSGWRDGRRGLYYALLMTIHSILVRFYHVRQSLKARSHASKLSNSIQLLTLSTIALIPFGQLMRYQVTTGVALYAFEVSMLVAVIAWIGFLVSRMRLPNTTPWIISLLVVSLTMGISLLLNASRLQSHLLSAALYWWRWLLYLAFGWLLWDGVVANWLTFSWRKAIEYFAFIYLFIGWMQYLFMPDMRWLIAYGWDDHYYRMIGSLFDPNFLGLLIVLYLIYIVAYGKTLKYVFGIITVVSLGLTYSRSAYAAFLAFTSLSIMQLRYFKQALLYSFVLGISLLAFSSLIKPGGEGVNLTRTYSIVHRARSIVTGWDIFMEHPYVGIGYNAYRKYTQPETHDTSIPYHPSSPDNSFVLILATTGIMGMASFGYFLLQFVYSVRKKPFQILSLGAILTHSLFNNSYFYPFILLWWMIITLELAPENVRKRNE
jgi:glycosyltransferase involved in cell wall biosynthesis